MTEEARNPPGKDDRRRNEGSNRGGGRRNISTGRPSSAASNGSGSRPASRNMKGKSSSPDPSLPDTEKNESSRRPQSQRGKGASRGGHRKAPSAAPTSGRTAISNGPTAKGNMAALADQQAPGQQEGGGALQSLQRVITDLKSISPPTNSLPLSGNTLVSAATNSNLPPDAPVFQPGAAGFPAASIIGASPVHRKAASLGSSPTSFPSNYTSPLQNFQSNLGSMEEDANELGAAYEDGEIPDSVPWQQQQQEYTRINQQTTPGFTAPRFAALAQQQQVAPGEVLGPTGRPQLAPGFTFGARRRSSAAAINMTPSIGEEDVDFQFPQQNQVRSLIQEDLPINAASRRVDSTPEVGGIMAEQIAIQTQIEALQQQQQQLYQQQLASSQVMASLSNPQMSGNRLNAHRRVQSTAPMLMSQGNFGMGNIPMSSMGNFGTALNMPTFGDDGSAQRGHGRRHSVNVFNNKPQGTPFGTQTQAVQEGFDDGFAPPPALGGHSRNPSRVDPNWRLNGSGVVGQADANLSANLSQAQAHLASLQQFRANAGGHHHKMPSFSFPNMLPNMMAANMMGLGGMNLNVFQQQQQQFQMQLQQQASQPQRKSLFAPYLPQASLPPLLAAGKLVVGILRVNKRNRSDAYVATEVLDADIYICGSKDRNRALEGDIVAIELLDVDEVWGTKKEKEEKKRKKEENAAYDTRASGNRKNDKKKDDVEVEGQGLMLFEDEEVTDEVKPQYAGHVVAVVERMPGQLFSGTLGLLRPSSAATKEKQEAERREREGDRVIEERRGPVERPKIVWFRPTDKRVPLIAIPTEQAPPDFVQNSESYTDKLFVACIKRHPISSLHPFGTLVEELGPIGDIEVETSALLKDCNFPTEEFNDNVLKCVPPTPWMIPEHELASRRDLRQERIFTIDPHDAKDLDDAVHIQLNEDGTYDVGVHIADVSYFVKPNTALDRDARKKGTSVYLVQRSVPMLPPVLCEQLCSLVPGEDRLAFSVIFTLTADARVINKWMGKTVIKSCAKLAYGQAQDVINGKSLTGTSPHSEHNPVSVGNDIKALNALAKQLRTRRFKSGILSSHSDRLTFSLDAAGLPTDCDSYERGEAHELIEEFMLLTNQAVAQQIAFSLPDQALLRRHEDPIERRLVGLRDKALRFGYALDTSSAGALTKSFESIENLDARKVLMLASHKAIHRAKYFCVGMLDIAKYHHYALNVPLYTHFTSPIRRYADVVVHRQLESILPSTGNESKFSMDRDSVAKAAQQCNIKRDSAKLAQEQSAHLYLCHLIADLTQRFGPVVRQAIVVGVLDAAFDVLLPEFGIEKRVHVDQMPIENHVYDEHNHVLSIYWSTRDVISWLAENSDDEHLKKVQQNAEQHALKMEVTSRSVHDESALFDEDEDEIVLAKETHEKETSKQRQLSKAQKKPQFENLRQSDGHKIQNIKELMTVPVIVTADLTKSPAVIKVYSVNPYAQK